MTCILVLLIISSSVLFGYICEENVLELSYSSREGGRIEIQANSKEITETLGDMELFFSAPVNHPSNIYIKIFKEHRVLELYGEDKLLGRFRIGLGQAPEGDKFIEGDSRTPEGNYYICTRNKSSKFTLFLGLNYPNTEDAERGLKAHLISQEAYNSIKAAEDAKQRSPWNTPLGGQIGIHGGGNERDWTQGCIALSDEDIILLGKYAAVNTPVLIFK